MNIGCMPLLFRLINKSLMNLKTNPFDQNRLYAAFGYNMNRSFNLQAGYLRHTTPNGGFNRLQFLLTVNIKKPSEDIMHNQETYNHSSRVK